MGIFNRRDKIVLGSRVKHPSAVVSHELEEYLLYLRSPIRMMWVNFIAGVFRGLGAVLGATAVVAAVLWFLTLIVSFPLIGDHVKDFHQQVIEFIEEARYTDDFTRIEALLKEIASKM